MADNIQHDETAVEELKAKLRLDIAKEERALHEKLERLRACKDAARSDAEYDSLTLDMEEAYREHKAAIAPLRDLLESLIRAQVAIRSLQPVVLFQGSTGSVTRRHPYPHPAVM